MALNHTDWALTLIFIVLAAAENQLVYTYHFSRLCANLSVGTLSLICKSRRHRATLAPHFRSHASLCWRWKVKRFTVWVQQKQRRQRNISVTHPSSTLLSFENTHISSSKVFKSPMYSKFIILGVNSLGCIFWFWRGSQTRYSQMEKGI